MLSWLRDIGTRWANWIGDRDTEDAIRQHLTQAGYLGRSATIEDLRLVAVQRPGWLQIYSYNVQAQLSHPAFQQLPDEAGNSNLVRLYGLLRQDERYNRVDIVFQPSVEKRNETLEQWSAGLVRLRRPAK